MWLCKLIAVQTGVYLNKYSKEIETRLLPKFGNSPKNLIITMPRRIYNSERIFMGDDVIIGPNSYLNAITEYPQRVWMRNLPDCAEIKKFHSKIKIGNCVTSTGSLMIGSCSQIVVEDEVMFATNVHISDHFHGYKFADIPYKFQMLDRISPIRIGRGSWIGQNVVIMPGVDIGEYSIIGANSVVTKNVPPGSIAAGVPAKVFKSWDGKTRQWKSFDCDSFSTHQKSYENN